MLNYLLFTSLLILNVFGSDHDHDHDHESHKHNDETLPHCECITGIESSSLDCTDQVVVDSIESYLVENNCASKCGPNVTESNFDLDCNQRFAALIQFHDWCETLTVNETLIHDLWDGCSLDCLQDFQNVPGAPECSEDVDCNNSTMLDKIINIAVDECNSTTCMPINKSSSLNCTAQLLLVESVHRGCSHDDFTENFDEKFDMNVNAWITNCMNTCNPPDTSEPNCTLAKNTIYTSLEGYTKLTIDILKGITTTTENPITTTDSSVGSLNIVYGLINLFLIIILQ